MSNIKPILKLLSVIIAYIALALPAYAQVNATTFGFTPNDPSQDASIAFQTMLTSLGNERTVYFPSGVYYFNTKPPAITNGVTFIGDQNNTTTFKRMYTTTTVTDALIHAKATIVFERISINADGNTNGGAGILLEGNGAGYSIIRDMNINTEAGSSWEVPLIAISYTGTIGIRNIHLDNLELFGGTIHSAWFVNVVGMVAEFDSYPGTPANGVSKVTFQSNNNQQSNRNDLKTAALTDMYLYDTHNLYFEGRGTNIYKDTLSTNIYKVKYDVVP